MRRTHLAAFLAIVLIPVCGLVWLGLRVASGEAQLRRHQFDQIIDDRLSDIRDRAQSAVDELERQILAALETPSDSEAFRDLGRSEPFVRQAFSVTAKGALAYPTKTNASREELEFLERTGPIWNRSSVLRAPPVSAADESKNAALVGPKEEAKKSGEKPPRGDDIVRLAERRNSGWLTWYWREGLHLLLWKAADSGVVGVEVERVALLSQIVAKLPTTESPDSRIALINSRGERVHQWGLYDPVKDEAPVATLDLKFPLDSWTLGYWAAPSQKSAFVSSGSRASVLVGAVAIAIALLTLAVFLFRDMRRRLREASERVNFVTRVSHELKTPLTNVRLYAELLDHELGSGNVAAVRENARKRLSIVVAESQRLTRLINNILTFSKHKRETLVISPSWIQIDEVVKETIAQFEPALREAGVSPKLSGGVSEPVFADADALGQIIANLLGNVLKYATDGKAVDVSSRRESDEVVIAVQDHGPGISEGDGQEIFKPFVRLSDSLSEGVSGTGIGLSIARELARLHGGELSFVAGSQQGALFELRLPWAEQNKGEELA